jgi:hypothetical protein
MNLNVYSMHPVMCQKKKKGTVNTPEEMLKLAALTSAPVNEC